MLVAALAIACGSLGPSPLATGVWGGDHIAMTITESSVHVELDCAHGDVPGSIDMATFYVPPDVGERVIGDVAKKGVGEVWFNPGAESDALIERARALAIRPIVACSIVAIGQNPYDF